MKTIKKPEYLNSRTIGPPQHYGTFLRCQTKVSQLRAMGIRYKNLPWREKMSINELLTSSLQPIRPTGRTHGNRP